MGYCLAEEEKVGEVGMEVVVARVVGAVMARVVGKEEEEVKEVGEEMVVAAAMVEVEGLEKEEGMVVAVAREGGEAEATEGEKVEVD